MTNIQQKHVNIEGVNVTCLICIIRYDTIRLYARFFSTLFVLCTALRDWGRVRSGKPQMTADVNKRTGDVIKFNL